MSKKKQKRIPRKLFLKQLLRISGVSVGVVALSFVLVAQEASAYFYDSEGSVNNLFAATSLDFSVHDEDEPPFRTQTQGGWGSEAHGDNPGTYRDANFDGAFPDGAVIGDPLGGYSAEFTTSAAVAVFLPAGGTPGPLSSDHTDPATTDAGVFAGQVLALTLNLGFDAYDADFGASNDPLSEWEMDDAGNSCFGLTAGAILNEANVLLGGGTTAYSASELNDCAAGVNERFVPDDGGISPFMMPGDSREFNVFLQKDGALDFNYQLVFDQTGGDILFCDTLTLRAALNGSDKYDDALGDLDAGPFTELGTWLLEITFPSGLPSVSEGALCEGDIVFEGWQFNLPIYPNGYSDEERVSISFVNRSIVLNEFLPNPTGDDDAPMPDGEWVELYNLSGFDADVAGWYIYDKSNAAIIIGTDNSDNDGDTGDSGETIVPGNGYLVVYLNGAYSPGWLNNTGGDRVRLYSGNKNAGGVLMDEYKYNGSAAQNKSFARIPDGTGDWVDPIPTPLAPNVLEGNEIAIATEQPVAESIDDVVAPTPVEEEVELPQEEEEQAPATPPTDEVIEAPNGSEQPIDTEVKLEDPEATLPQPTTTEEDPTDEDLPVDGGDNPPQPEADDENDTPPADEEVVVEVVDESTPDTETVEEVPLSEPEDEVVIVQDIIPPEDGGQSAGTPITDEPTKQEEEPVAPEPVAEAANE